LAGLRLVPGLEVGEAAEMIWLRGNRGDEQLERKLAALPARGRYERIAPNQLRPVDERIPSRRMPEIHWRPLQAWLQVETPFSALPADGPRRASLVLERSSEEREAGLLLTRLEELTRFAASAAKVRLDRLQFAATRDGEALARGTPLPPVPGRRFVLRGRVAVPAGFSWRPAVSVDVLERVLGVSGDALLLWNEDGTVIRLLGEQFVPLTRGALAATEKSLSEPA
jgi:hypothetical protein